MGYTPEVHVKIGFSLPQEKIDLVNRSVSSFDYDGWEVDFHPEVLPLSTTEGQLLLAAEVSEDVWKCSHHGKNRFIEFLPQEVLSMIPSVSSRALS